MKRKDLKPEDCATKGVETRKEAINQANALTSEYHQQHSTIKIDGKWYAFNVVTTFSK